MCSICGLAHQFQLMARFLCHSSMQRRKTLLEMTLFVKFLCIIPTWKFWYWRKRITALGTRAINLLLDNTFKVCWFSSFIAKFDSTCAALMLTALLSCDNSEISRGKPPHSRIVFCEYKQSSLLWHFMTRLYYRWVTAYFTEINIALLNWRVFDPCILRDGWWKGRGWKGGEWKWRGWVGGNSWRKSSLRRYQ